MTTTFGDILHGFLNMPVMLPVAVIALTAASALFFFIGGSIMSVIVFGIRYVVSEKIRHKIHNISDITGEIFGEWYGLAFGIFWFGFWIALGRFAGWW